MTENPGYYTKEIKEDPEYDIKISIKKTNENGNFYHNFI